jgi:MoaA/NifB/PqqE/SkfB family radical SAM enzyme
MTRLIAQKDSAMSTFYDQARSHFLQDTHFKLRQVFVYATTKCNSLCQTCRIYEREVAHLSVAAAERIADFVRVRDDAMIFFEGGEFFLHPEYEAILELARGLNYCVVSNGQLTRRIVDAVERHGIPRIAFSLDGPRETYRRVRGIDGFEALMRTLMALKGRTRISIDSTINPWNSHDDLRWVKSFCDEHGFGMAVQPMYPIAFFGSAPRKMEDYFFDVSDLMAKTSFLDASVPFFRDELYLPCLNVREAIVVYPNGDVPLCHMRDGEILGNLNERGLAEISDSRSARERQAQALTCNRCWLNCQRIADVKLFEYFEERYPHAKLVEHFGPYSWPLPRGDFGRAGIGRAL